MSWVVVVSVGALVVSSMCSGEGDGGCPEDVLSSASRCLPSGLSHGLINNLTAVRLKCREGVFKRTAQCLSGLEASCRDHPEDVGLLQHLVDLRAWRTAWNTLCTHLADLEENYSCWTVTSQRSSICVATKMAELWVHVQTARDVRLSAALVSSSSSSSSSASSSSSQVSRKRAVNAVVLSSLKAFCNISREILRCFHSTLYDACPLGTARLLEDTYLAFQPPLCKRQHRTVSEDAGGRPVDEEPDKQDDRETTVNPSVTSLATIPTPRHKKMLVTSMFAVLEMVLVFV
ncbi:uncharacterized protein LOC143299391 [Babylonia areolata]|uniref:uncharacterized protein LOC143299391 n=1 Tax=Babylonia areolata TaxID=304850 RepID=UPI003FD6898C